MTQKFQIVYIFCFDLHEFSMKKLSNIQSLLHYKSNIN
jgi:hypothetical protein